MSQKNRSSQSTRGFTLLEVLIAVLILGIIATAALPMLGSYTEKAREAREDANFQIKARAIDRYNLEHQAPLGTVYDPSDSSLVTYGLETMQGPTAQLLFPTDVNGNVLDDPMTSNPGPYSYGPYLAELPPEPASLLASTTSDRGVHGLAKSGLDVVLIVTGVVNPQLSVSLRVRKYDKTGPFKNNGISNMAGDTATNQWFTTIVPATDDEIAELSRGEAGTIIPKIFAAMNDAAQRAAVLVGLKMWSQSERRALDMIGNAIEYIKSSGEAETREENLRHYAKTLPVPDQLSEIFHRDPKGSSPFIVAAMAEKGVRADLDALNTMAIKGTASAEQRSLDMVAESYRKIVVLEKQKINAAIVPDGETDEARNERLLLLDRVTQGFGAAKAEFLAAAAREAASLGLTPTQAGDFTTSKDKVRVLYDKHLGLSANVRLNEHGDTLARVVRTYQGPISEVRAMGTVPYYEDISHVTAGFTQADYDVFMKTGKNTAIDGMPDHILVDRSTMRFEFAAKAAAYYPRSGVTAENVDQVLLDLARTAHQEWAAIEPIRSGGSVNLMTPRLRDTGRQPIRNARSSNIFVGPQLPPNVRELLNRLKAHIRWLYFEAAYR